jgi:hypothetical protein
MLKNLLCLKTHELQDYFVRPAAPVGSGRATLQLIFFIAASKMQRGETIPAGIVESPNRFGVFAPGSLFFSQIRSDEYGLIREVQKMTKGPSIGKCRLCGDTFDKLAMAKHLKSCKQKKGSKAASGGRGARKADVFHLLVEGRYNPEYWMHVELPANAQLKVLDSFLRDIWLECCGHMSMFTIQDKRYSIVPMEEFDDQSMEARLSEVLSPGMKFSHEYDFGSTTYLVLKVITREQKPLKDSSVRILAMNEPPEIPCVRCGKPATQVCTECIYSDAGWLCDTCAAEHECGQEMLLPVVNSPRVGVCGYAG